MQETSVRTAGVFPGQGSQAVGMGRFLFDNFSLARQRFEEASDTLSQDFKKLCFEGPESDLTLTRNTQPALLLVSTATVEVVREICNPNFTYFAGHSIGEYAALVATQTLAFRDALIAVRARGEAMQSAVPLGQGAMLAVMGWTPQEVEQLCHWVTREAGQGPLEIANDNAPGQIVISGTAGAAQWLRDNYKTDSIWPEGKRLKCIPLNVSAPFHCSLMMPAQRTMEGVLSDMQFRDAHLPVVQNYTAQPHSSAQELRSHLIAQVSGRVRWVESVEKMHELQVTRFLELGAGKVLSGLIKKIKPEGVEVHTSQTLEDIRALEQWK